MRWSIPARDGGYEITSWNIYVTLASQPTSFTLAPAYEVLSGKTNTSNSDILSSARRSNLSSIRHNADCLFNYICARVRNLAIGTTYLFKVSAVNRVGESAWSVASPQFRTVGVPRKPVIPVVLFIDTDPIEDPTPRLGPATGTPLATVTLKVVPSPSDYGVNVTKYLGNENLGG